MFLSYPHSAAEMPWPMVHLCGGVCFQRVCRALVWDLCVLLETTHIHPNRQVPGRMELDFARAGDVAHSFVPSIERCTSIYSAEEHTQLQLTKSSRAKTILQSGDSSNTSIESSNFNHSPLSKQMMQKFFPAVAGAGAIARKMACDGYICE